MRSAREVLGAIDHERFEVGLAGLTRDGLLRTGPADADLEAVLANGTSLATLTELKPDVVFPVLHGPGGEDGAFQGYLETLGLPYVGSGVAASALCMDKEWVKRLLATHDVSQVAWLALERRDWEDVGLRMRWTDRLARTLGFPCFIKPANMGSSVGVHRVSGLDHLEGAVADTFRFDTRLVAERGVDARDIEVAVLGNGGPETLASEPGEILLPPGRWYDYETKYLNDDAKLQIPAALPVPVAQTLKQVALDVFRALGCRGLCRVDFLVERETNAVYLNEPNTLPGFTTASMYPKLMGHAGVSYPKLVERLVDLALAAHRERASLSLLR